MTPYFENHFGVVYHASCSDLAIECDLLLTDPPYGQSFKSNRADNWGKIIGDDDPTAIVVALTKVLKGLKSHRHAYIFSGRLDLSALPFSATCELVWDKGMIGSGNLSLPWGPQHEKILFGVYCPSKANRDRGDGRLSARLRRGSVLKSLRANATGVKLHQTEKPVDILRQMIEASTIMGDVVYDPFCGSGSTLVAAALEGRKAVGCEIDEGYCETAAKRLRDMDPYAKEEY